VLFGATYGVTKTNETTRMQKHLHFLLCLSDTICTIHHYPFKI
jgi:hypothetical protein